MNSQSKSSAASADASASAEILRRTALRFVVLVGFTSLFADMTYEGARSITGPFLGTLGASGALVSTIAGLGELVGYGLRLASGYFADRSRRYWAITIVGYAINMLAVPLLALAGRWEVAAALMILERAGKAIRTPARDAMLSNASHRLGGGWAFGLHEALDQTGATVGPLIVTAVLFFGGTFHVSFAVLLAPALLALAALAFARISFPHPRDLDPTTPELHAAGFDRRFRLYLIAAALVAAGYADFPLIAFHFHATGVVPATWGPVLYALGMISAAVSALVFGRLFDLYGLPILAVSTLMAALFAPLVFFGGLVLSILGMVLWGLGMGAHESIMRAAVSAMTPPDKRASAYGVFNAVYGVTWFLGSVLLGLAYDRSIVALVAISLVLQLAAIPLFLAARRTPLGQQADTR
jgi:MFS family permease